mgnify:CR=1 FL=1
MSRITKKLKLPALDLICRDDHPAYSAPIIGIKYQQFRGEKCFIATDGHIFACFNAKSLKIEVKCSINKVIPRRAWTEFRKANRVELLEDSISIMYEDGFQVNVGYVSEDRYNYKNEKISLYIKEDTDMFSSDKIFSGGRNTSFFDMDVFHKASKILCFDKSKNEVFHYSSENKPNLLLAEASPDRFCIVMPCNKENVRHMDSSSFVRDILREDKIPF